jgi:hypothetical protein
VLSILRAASTFLLSSLSTTRFFEINGRSESVCSFPRLESAASRETLAR